MRRIFISIVLSKFLSGCQSDVEYVKYHDWKYGGGFCYAGDWLNFGTGSIYQIKGDTLYKHDTAIATIILTFNELPAGKNQLKINCLGSTKTGTYFEK